MKALLRQTGSWACAALLSVALVPGLGIAAPAATVTAGDFFPIDYAGKHLVAYATGTNAPTDNVGVEVSGTVPLKVSLTQDRHNAVVTPTTEQIIFLIDGVPVSGVLSAPYTFNWNSVSVADGAHVLSAILVDGPTDLSTYRIEPTTLIVDNGSHPRTTAQRVPSLGATIQSQHLNSATPDWLSYPGGTQPPHPVARPYTHLVIPPASSLADPNAALSQDNWLLEPLTQPITGLYLARPRYFKTRNGYVVIKQMNTQSGSSAEGAEPLLPSHGHYDGPRNDNSVSLYSTVVPEPGGPTWLGVDLIGRLFRIAADGTVTTLAGEVTRRDVLPLDMADVGITTAMRRTAQFQTVGSFDNNLMFQMATDLAIDPRNPNIVYVADSAHHRVAKVDLGASPVRISTYVGLPATAGSQDGSAATATFTEPWSLAIAADGTLYVADRTGNTLRKVSPDGGTVSTVLNSSDGIAEPFVIRLDSNGQIILGDNKTATVKRVNPATKAVATITSSGCATEWIWLDVDRKGNVGPKDDILFICGTGGSANTVMKRISADGTRNVQVLDGSGPASQGSLRIVSDAHGHYPWVVAIDDQEGRILTGGFGNMGVNMLRMRLSEALPETASGTFQLLYANGRELFRRGTVPGFPFGARPSFTALLGENGHSYLGIKNFDDMEAMTDAELTAYIQGGLGGSVPRPEITGRDLRALVFYMRQNMRSSVTAVPTPMALPADTTAAVVSDVTVTPIDATSARVQWTTSEPTLGYVAFGPNLAYHRWTDIETGYGTSHSAVLTYLPAGKAIHFAVRAKDTAGNQTLTADQTFTTSGATVPATPTLVFSATPSAVAAGGTTLLSWTASDATGCTASGGWTQAVTLSGSAISAALSANTTFTLTCSGAGGQVDKSVTVTLSTPAAPPTLAITSPLAAAHITGTTLTVSVARGGDQANVDHMVLQLDTTTPVSTTATSYAFTGVAAGTHTVSAWLAKADGAKIAGTDTQVQVTVEAAGSTPVDPPPPTKTTPASSDGGGGGGCTVDPTGTDTALPLLLLAALSALWRRRMARRGKVIAP